MSYGLLARLISELQNRQINRVWLLTTSHATAAKIAISHDPAIIYKPGDGVVSSGLAYVAVRACQAVVC